MVPWVSVEDSSAGGRESKGDVEKKKKARQVAHDWEFQPGIFVGRKEIERGGILVSTPRGGFAYPSNGLGHVLSGQGRERRPVETGCRRESGNEKDHCGEARKDRGRDKLRKSEW